MVGLICGTTGFAVGFFGPPLLVAGAFLFPRLFGAGEIGALFPFVGIVLGPIGFIVCGLIGLVLGAFIGFVRQPPAHDENEPPIAKP